MYTLKHTRIMDNYLELIRSGLDKYMARFIAVKLAASVVLEVAISDVGVHVALWETGTSKEKTMVFKFTA